MLKLKDIIYMRLNSIRIWRGTQVLPFKFQYATSLYYILKNRHNHTQSILIHI